MMYYLKTICLVAYVKFEFHGIKKHSGLEDEKFNDVINLLKSLEFKYTRNVGRVFMFKR